MKYAEISYVGPMRSVFRKGESGTEYRFRSPMGGNPRPVAVHNLQDALSLAEQDVFEVDWTVQGEVAKRVGPSASNAKDALADLSYRQKQRLTSTLNLDVKGNAKEDELEEALEPAVEEMLTNAETR